MDKPQYKKKPIGYVDSLAKALSAERDHLIRVANDADSFYRLHKRIEKPDGTFREIYDARYPLKLFQRRINRKLISRVDFPQYLHAVKHRSHITAASKHNIPLLLLNLDISNFFPSISSELVFDIWRLFFRFPKHVSQMLTKLTTYNGFLPQGAPTSPGLANLAFWDIESKLVEGMNAKGFVYTRFVDDVTISSERKVQMDELAPIIASIFGMFRNRGVKANRNKIHISTSGHEMLVHNLNINSGVPTIPKRERGRIRAAVKDCEITYTEIIQTEVYKKLWHSTLGRVNYLNHFHPTEAQKYHQRLQAVRPS
ncbi:MAG: RNA-directed DNA polymerase [Anaerolineaceae bacterium]|nr:RNA-directed DNA polymerase [Anaerolineaceae bacterium]